MDHKKKPPKFAASLRALSALYFLSHQWRHSRHHWEILDEEGTLLKSI